MTGSGGTGSRVQAHVGEGSGKRAALRRTRVRDGLRNIGGEIDDEFPVNHQVIVGLFEVQREHLYGGAYRKMMIRLYLADTP